MQSLRLKSAIFMVFVGLSGPILSEAHSILETTTTDTEVLSNLLIRWDAETDILSKAEIAKQLQQQLRVKVDNLIGRKTVAASKAKGMTTSFNVPTRAENKKTKFSLAVSEGTLTQEKADALNAGEASVQSIRAKVKLGDLSREDSRSQISAIHKTSPAKVAQSDLATQTDVAPKITGLAADLAKKGYLGFTLNTGLFGCKNLVAQKGEGQVALRLSNDLTVKSVNIRVDANGNGKFSVSEKASKEVKNEVETLISGIDKNYEYKVKTKWRRQQQNWRRHRRWRQAIMPLSGSKK